MKSNGTAGAGRRERRTFSAEFVTGTSYALVGQTPVVRATGQRFGCSMISAITNRGQLLFRVFHSTFRAPMFVDFMRRMRAQSDGKVYLIVDGHPVHRSRLAKAYVAAHPDDIRLIQLPGYCPELNPDELLNQDVKTNALGKSRPRSGAACSHRRREPTALVRRLTGHEGLHIWRVSRFEKVPILPVITATARTSGEGPAANPLQFFDF